MNNVFKNLFGMIALVISGLSFAAPVAKVENLGNNAILVMHNTPCVSEKALKIVKPDFHNRFMHGEYTYNGKTIVACWAVNGATIYIADEEGDQGRIPIEAAQPLGGKETL